MELDIILLWNLLFLIGEECSLGIFLTRRYSFYDRSVAGNGRMDEMQREKSFCGCHSNFKDHKNTDYFYSL